jgi:hypothetical protein
LDRLVVYDHPNVLASFDFDTRAIEKLLYCHCSTCVQNAKIGIKYFPFSFPAPHDPRP